MSEQLPNASEVTFPAAELAMIDEFNSSLRRVGYQMNEYPDEAGQQLESMLGYAAGDAMNPEQVSASTRRVILAGALGATQNQQMASSLLEALCKDDALDDQDKQVVSGMTNNLWTNRHYSDSFEQVDYRVADEVGFNLTALGRLEEQGQDKTALKTVLLAFGAGATFRSPRIQAAEQLMQTLEAHRAKV